MHGILFRPQLFDLSVRFSTDSRLKVPTKLKKNTNFILCRMPALIELPKLLFLFYRPFHYSQKAGEKVENLKMKKPWPHSRMAAIGHNMTGIYMYERYLLG